MYVTRPLSQLLRSPESVAAPPDGPNSGYLVIQDEESETYSCFGMCKNPSLKELPFPQNKELIAQYIQSTGQSSYASLDPVLLVPVLNQPLSSNLYYTIVPHGKHKGEAYTCSREEDKTTCCFCRYLKEVKPRPLDPQNVYQQIQVVKYEGVCASAGYFYAKSRAPDGFPPYFLRREGWTVNTKTPKYFKLDAAQGVDSNLRARLPGFDFSLSRQSSESVVVGKWYCPFIFVKEGTLRDQVERSMYYEVTLEQRWEQIFTCRKNAYDHNSVVIDTLIEKEEAFVGGSKAVWNEKQVVDGVIWFTSYGPDGQGMILGLWPEVVQRMKWEQERVGVLAGEKGKVKIKKGEDFKDAGEWTEFGCYILVERFNFKRMDGSLALSYDFKHFHQMKSKWE